MIRAIIFDCFGVVISDALSVLCSELIPDNPAALEGVWHFIDEANRGILTSEESSRQIAQLFGLTPGEYRARISEGEVKDQALLNYIAGLRKSYKTAMLSNIPMGSLARRFKEGELERYFDAVVASGEIGYAKPEAAAYEITAETLGVSPSECIFVDDRARYLDGARAVGMRTVLYESFSAFRVELEALLPDA